MSISKIICNTIILTAFFLVGCNPGTAPVNSKGIKQIDSTLLGETAGCQIFEVDTTYLPTTRMFLSKCPGPSSVTFKTGKLTVTNNSVVVPVNEPSPEQIRAEKRAEALGKLTQEERDLLNVK